MKTRLNSYLTSARGRTGADYNTCPRTREGKESQGDVSSFRLKRSAPVSIHNLGAWELDSHSYLGMLPPKWLFLPNGKEAQSKKT